MSLIYTPSYKKKQQPQPQKTAPITAPFQSSQRKKGLLERVEDITTGIGIDPLVGAAKSIGSNVLGASELGQKIFNPWSWGGSEEAKASQKLTQDIRNKYTSPTNVGQSVGFTAGQVAQAMLPGASGFGGIQAARAMSGVPQVARLAGAALTEALPQTLLGASQEGGITKNAMISGILSGAGAVAGKIPNALLSIGQLGSGIGQLYEGDVAGGAMNIAFGALGARNVVKTPGLLLNREVMPSMKLDKAISIYDEIFGVSKRISKRQQRSELSGRETKTPGQIAMEHGVILESDGNNALKTTAARKDVQEKINSWDDLLEQALDDQYKANNLTELRDSLVSRIRSGNLMKNLSATDREAAIRSVNKSFKAEIKQNGNLVSDKQLNQIKRGLYNSSYNEGMPRSGSEALRISAGEMRQKIESNNPDVAVRQINEIMGELLSLDMALKDKHGSVIRGGLLGKRLNQVIGAIAGGNLGPFGSLIGSEVGAGLTDYALDPYRKTIAVQRGLDLSGFVSPQERMRGEVGQQLYQRFEDSMMSRNQPKQLPAGTTIYGEPAPYAPTPQMSQEEIVAELRRRGYQGTLTQQDMQLSRPALPPPSAMYEPYQMEGGSRLYSQAEAQDYLAETGSLSAEKPSLNQVIQDRRQTLLEMGVLPSAKQITQSLAGTPLERMELIQRLKSAQ